MLQAAVFSTGGSNAGKDYSNGNRWQQAQQKLAVQQAPLFTLYDDEGVKVDNIAKYPNSDFVGCPCIFYNTNNTTGTYDEIQKQMLFDQSGKFSSEHFSIQESHCNIQNISYSGCCNYSRLFVL